jgi:hypothetical protein
MAGRTGWSVIVILAYNPLILIKVKSVFEAAIGDTVLGFLVNFFLGMIWSQMTFAAVLRLACLIFGK